MPTALQTATGLLKAFTKKEVERIKNSLINNGHKSAIATTCTLFHRYTGLPESVCKTVTPKIVNFVTKEIRRKLKK